MEHLSSDMEQQNQDQHQEQQQLQWRRDKVQELCSKGYSQREISQILQVGLANVNRDIFYLRSQAKANIKRYIDERLRLYLRNQRRSQNLAIAVKVTKKNQTNLITMKIKISLRKSKKGRLQKKQ
jgi:Trp operon repressor